MPIPDLSQIFTLASGILLLKIPLLILLGIYILFLLIVISRIRAFNRLVHVAAGHGSKTLEIFAVIQFILSLSLFFLAIVIV